MYTLTHIDTVPHYDVNPLGPSRVIFENAHYSVCVTRAGLSANNRRTGKGHVLSPYNPHAKVWLEAFDEPLRILADPEKKELHSLAAEEAHNIAKAIAQGDV